VYNINVVNGDYFRTYKWLSQGEPLSLILFNQVVAALQSLLNSAKPNGNLLVPGGVSHLQYVDDIFLLAEHDEESLLFIEILFE
jgi:hypothetical protein